MRDSVISIRSMTKRSTAVDEMGSVRRKKVGIEEKGRIRTEVFGELFTNDNTKDLDVFGVGGHGLR